MRMMISNKLLISMQPSNQHARNLCPQVVLVWNAADRDSPAAHPARQLAAAIWESAGVCDSMQCALFL